MGCARGVPPADGRQWCADGHSRDESRSAWHGSDGHSIRCDLGGPRPTWHHRIVVGQPETPNPRRPVIGLEDPREEVSGTRLWGLLAEHYGDADAIASKVFLVNHCPLMLFSGPRATNITPDKVGGPTARALLKRCDEHLREVMAALDAERVIGVGKFAESRARSALANHTVEVVGCWHPSPASPLANRNGGADWRANVRAVLT